MRVALTYSPHLGVGNVTRDSLYLHTSWTIFIMLSKELNFNSDMVFDELSWISCTL